MHLGRLANLLVDDERIVVIKRRQAVEHLEDEDPKRPPGITTRQHSQGNTGHMTHRGESALISRRVVCAV